MSRLFAAFVFLAALPSLALTDRSGPYELQVLVDGQSARTFQHNGETFVLGSLDRRYTLRVTNHSGQRIEAVVSVDGRDVIDGKPAEQGKRGYLVPAFGSVDIDGWRISQREAAAFRFSTVPESYAARTGRGRDVGVIGVAIFPERFRPPPRPLYMPPPPPSQPREPMSNNSLDMDRAPSAAAPQAMKSAPRAEQRPGLGTSFGEAVSSQVTEVPFERARQRPDSVIGVRYDDREGLIAMGIEVERRMTDTELRTSADPFPGYDRNYAQPPPGWQR